MEQFSPVPMDMPATYRICVIGDLDSNFAERIWGMTSSPLEQPGKPDQTILIGDVTDQAALIGIVNALYAMGYMVESVEHIGSNEEHGQNDNRSEQ